MPCPWTRGVVWWGESERRGGLGTSARRGGHATRAADRGQGICSARGLVGQAARVAEPLVIRAGQCHAAWFLLHRHRTQGVRSPWPWGCGAAGGRGRIACRRRDRRTGTAVRFRQYYYSTTVRCGRLAGVFHDLQSSWFSASGGWPVEWHADTASAKSLTWGRG